jgi:type II restriction/modification system DNA methylase subunit YeeA
MTTKETAYKQIEELVQRFGEQIDYCENRINEIVYQLYDLTADEIKIVEGK